MIPETNNEEQNKRWFDFYVEQLTFAPKTGFKKVDNFFLCPCCHFPTLTERSGFNICFLCHWEDDGQDDHNADLILGGPNKSYSLTEARHNFSHYLTSYRPSDKHAFEHTTIRKSKNEDVVTNLTEIKKQIIDKYISITAMHKLNDRKQVFADIHKLARNL